jgi:hypothetical protein
MDFLPGKICQKALFDAGIPALAFFTSDVQAEYLCLKNKGIVFRGEPTNMGSITVIVFEDPCGNLINLVQTMV